MALSSKIGNSRGRPQHEQGLRGEEECGGVERRWLL